MRNTFPDFDSRISIQGDCLRYEIEDIKVIFPIRDLLLIGEFSTQPGTTGADYFFAFLIKGFEKMLEIPAYTENMFQVLNELKVQLPGLQNPTLQMSVDFASNVLWPDRFAGQELYDFESKSKPVINLPVLRKLARLHSVEKSLHPGLLEFKGAIRSR